jgi:hypothetical protein
MENAGKLLLVGAAVLAAIGLVLVGLARLGVTELPGTLRWRSRSGDVNVVVPIGLMIVLSLVATIVLNWLSRR